MLPASASASVHQSAPNSVSCACLCRAQFQAQLNSALDGAPASDDDVMQAMSRALDQAETLQRVSSGSGQVG